MSVNHNTGAMQRYLTQCSPEFVRTFHADAASASLWLARGTSFDTEQQAAMLSMLGGDETRRYAGFSNPLRQLQFLIGRSLLRLALAASAKVPPRSIDIQERSGHAPLVTLPSATPQMNGATPYFSLSHSKQFISCLVCKNVPVGLDIEFPMRGRDIEALSNAAFNEDECNWLQLQSPDLRQQAFYRLWNTKEALYKLMSSLDRPLASLPSMIDADGNFCSTNEWHGLAFSHAELFLAVCSSQPIASLRIIEDIAYEHFLCV